MTPAMKLRRTFLPLWIFIFLFKFAGSLYYTLLAPLGERILPIWIVGILVSFASLLQLFLDVPAGLLLDRFGYHRMLRLTSMVLGLGGIALLFGLHIWTYLLMILCSAVGWLFFGPGTSAYVLSHAPLNRSGVYIGLREAFSSAGTVCSMLLIPFAILLPDHLLGGCIAAVLCAASIVTFFLQKNKPAKPTQHIETHAYYVRRHMLPKVIGAIRELNPASTMLALTTFSAATFYGVIWFTVPLVIAQESERGLLSIGLSVFDLAGVVCGSLFGKLVDHSNKKQLIFIGLLLFSLAAMLMGLHFGVWFIVLGFLATSGDELAGISLWSWLNQLDRQHAHDGLVAGVITLFEDIGWTVGPLLAGFLFTLIGPSFTIVAGSSFIFMTWIISSILLHRLAPTPFSIKSRIPRRPHRARLT